MLSSLMVVTVQKRNIPQCPSPVTARVDGAEGVAPAGQAADGAVGEVIVFTLLTLQSGVTRHTVTLTRLPVALVRVRHAFTAAVTHQLFREDTEKFIRNFRQPMTPEDHQTFIENTDKVNLNV